MSPAAATNPNSRGCPNTPSPGPSSCIDPDMGRRTRIYKRQELYELVWSRPMYQAAKHFGVSDVTLRNWCVKLDVPIPDRGHWSRIAAGHEIARPTLPVSAKTEFEVEWWEDETAALLPSEAASAQARTTVEATIDVPEQLTKPHALVIYAQKHMGRTPGDDGLLTPGRGCLALSTSPKNLERALRIMDALIKALEARGHRVVVEDVPVHNDHWRPRETRSATFVSVDDVNIEFSLTEPVILTPLPPSLADKDRRSRRPEKMGRPRHPSGNLCLTVHDGTKPRHWRDRSRRKLEVFQPEFVAHLYIVADWRKQVVAAAAERRRREEEVELQRKRQAERAAAEKRRIEDLHQRLDRWRLARDLREYAAEIRAIVCLANADVDENDEVAKHLDLALTYADRLDPLTSLRQELAEDALESTE